MNGPNGSENGWSWDIALWWVAMLAASFFFWWIGSN